MLIIKKAILYKYKKGYLIYICRSMRLSSFSISIRSFDISIDIRLCDISINVGLHKYG